MKVNHIKLLAAENEQLTKEQLEERLINLKENSVLRNKPLMLIIHYISLTPIP